MTQPLLKNTTRWRKIFICYFLGLGYIEDSLNGSDSNNWKLIFAFPALLLFCRSCILKFRYKMDSPITLIKRDKYLLAKQILRKIYQLQYEDQAFLECKLRVQKKSDQEKGYSVFSLKSIEQQQQLAAYFVFVYTWSGLFALFSYSLQIFSEMSKDDTTLNAMFNLIIGIVQFAPALISKYVYGRWDKRSLLLFRLTVLILCQILIIGLSYSEERYLIYFHLYLFILICIEFGTNYLGNSMILEINSSEGTYFCFVTLYAWKLLFSYIFQLMFDTLALSGSFIFFLNLTLLSTTFFYFLLKKQKDQHIKKKL
ncbi:unnamed protein product [Paramecium pentaurelia]|uniref:Uncharacterized protein n=1 Tax=Paramecium pentaurelia TaxID=43138 RepID=A0A8S1SNF0_9CILI|nr:unnamed protein product [Paramecium pentaurelia]